MDTDKHAQTVNTLAYASCNNIHISDHRIQTAVEPQTTPNHRTTPLGRVCLLNFFHLPLPLHFS